jgi:hypothetical protein
MELFGGQSEVGLTETEIVGGAWTVRIPTDVVALPQLLVNTARYRRPFIEYGAANVNVVLVAPEMSPQVEPPLVLICH